MVSRKADEEEISELLSRMTVKEKIAQLGSVTPDKLQENGEFSREKAREFLSEGMGEISRPGGGSDLPPKETARLANEIQEFLEQETRLGLPAILHEECLSGYMGAGGTTYPQIIGLASSWKPELVKEITTEIRNQLRAIGTHQALSPVLDVARDFRWGRVEETFGEDPYLVAVLGMAYIQGLQGSDPKEGINATAKHLGGHSLPEGGRNHCPVNLARRELRENFLFPFEVAVKEADVRAIMNAYHDLDGVPCACSKQLLTELLRDEWNFDGIVVSDYHSIRMLNTEHRVAKDKQEAAIMAMKAGLDVELPVTECYDDKISTALADESLSEKTLDRAVRRVLRAKLKKGLLDGDNIVDEEQVNTYFETVEQRRLARKAARESMVLLKNEGDVLPLRNDLDLIGVVGPNADSTRNLLGDYAYSVHVESEEDTIPVTTVLEGIRNSVSSETDVSYAEGCKVKGDSKDDFDSALEVARKSELVIVVVGGKSGLGLVDPENPKEKYPHTTGEGSDRTDLRLPGVQLDLLKEIKRTNTPIVTVLINGRPLSVPWLENNVEAILEAWLPGEEGGNAVGDVLFGKSDPGGKLPVSVPRSVGQTPMYYRRRRLSKKRHYVFTPNRPLYPFGHGLSYTEFSYSKLRIVPERIKPPGNIKITCRISNTSDLPGKEVVQLYLRDEYASITRPERELRGFQKVRIKPGGERLVSFLLSTDLLSFRDREGNPVVEPGEFTVMIGSSSEDIRLKDGFVVTGEKYWPGPDRKYFAKTETS